jgi:hypothetical protein
LLPGVLGLVWGFGWRGCRVCALAAVVRAGAWPGELLGEEGFDDAGALAVAGFAVGGAR